VPERALNQHRLDAKNKHFFWTLIPMEFTGKREKNKKKSSLAVTRIPYKNLHSKT